jgi:ATP-dependent exoDNAse (exonuclease V) beta subunit
MKIELVGASAGTGKTWRVSHEIADAVRPDAPMRARVEALMAVTYTRKAAAELTSRIRQTLVEAGDFESLQRLPLAHIGTVHSVCFHLLGEFAYEAGLPPDLQVMPEDETKRVVEQAFEEDIPEDLFHRLEALSRTLKPHWDVETKRSEWIEDVRDVVALARSNRIEPSRLAGMAKSSADGLLKLLPAAGRDGDVLDEGLARAIVAAIKTMEKYDDEQKNTRKALEVIRDARQERSTTGTLAWETWARLSKVAPGASHRETVEPLIVAAARHPSHPRLHAELREYIACVFAAAASVLEGYARWKQERRYIDYIDMEERTLGLLSLQSVQDVLRDRLDLFVVDELQDTSPIQLALFLAFARLARRSIWVGDRKQSIFAFAGADPLLMDAVARMIARKGGKPDVLDTNRRSRPELVEVVSALFSKAFARYGFSPEEVRSKAHRKVEVALSALPPLGCWWLGSRNREGDAEAIAAGVAKLLKKPGDTRVLDRQNGETRDLRAGDVAILCRTNAEAATLAGALEGRGIRASLPRSGLIATPEGAFVVAALRRACDPSDRLSLAEMDVLTGFEGLTPDEWLERIIEAGLARKRGDRSRAEDADPGEAPGQSEPGSASRAATIDAVRGSVRRLSPSEALDALIHALDVETACRRWPRASERLGNLEALRALSLAYEERCAWAREAGTLGGLVRYLGELAGAGEDSQHVTAGHVAVQIST